MPKKYVFEFSGTKDMFLDTLRQFPNNDGKFYYFNDYSSSSSKPVIPEEKLSPAERLS